MYIHNHTFACIYTSNINDQIKKKLLTWVWGVNLGWLPGKVAMRDWRDESAGGDLNLFNFKN